MEVQISVYTTEHKPGTNHTFWKSVAISLVISLLQNGEKCPFMVFYPGGKPAIVARRSYDVLQDVS